MFYCPNFNTVSEGGVSWMPDKEIKPVMEKAHHQKSSHIYPNVHLNFVKRLLQSKLINVTLHSFPPTAPVCLGLECPSAPPTREIKAFLTLSHSNDL